MAILIECQIIDCQRIAEIFICNFLWSKLGNLFVDEVSSRILHTTLAIIEKTFFHCLSLRHNQLYKYVSGNSFISAT